MKHTVRHLALFALACLLLALWSCAKQGYPTGGPKDTAPPKVIKTSPASQSLGFSDKKFFIEFDEYVTIKDADNNILISPPMAEKPEYSTKGRGILVKIKDTLQPNTTYLFQFMGAIVDFNEGNALPSFEYVFSTGPSLDSMSLRGTVLDALSLKPRTEQVSVLAFSEAQLADSVVSKVHPAYVTRCNVKGEFQFNYIRPGRYMVMALEDADKNLRYAPSEAAAWADTLVAAFPMPKPAQPDTASADSAAAPPDSVPVPSLSLLLSLKEQQVQRVTKSGFLRKGYAEIATQLPLVNPRLQADSVLWTLNARRDTISLWTLRQSCDSLYILLSDTNLQDTLKLKFRESRKGKKPKQESDELNSITSLVAKEHPYFDTLWFRFNAPVSAASIDSVALLSIPDSSLSKVPAFLDSNRVRAYIFAPDLMLPGRQYRLSIPARSLRDIYGRWNDSLLVSTTLTAPERYGTLTLEFSSSFSNPVLQLLNDKDEVVAERPNPSPKETFSNLKAGSYRFRLFDDLDHDGRWSPGVYYQHLQPEPVAYFGKNLQLRENWEMSETWSCPSPQPK